MEPDPTTEVVRSWHKTSLRRSTRDEPLRGPSRRWGTCAWGGLFSYPLQTFAQRVHLMYSRLRIRASSRCQRLIDVSNSAPWSSLAGKFGSSGSGPVSRLVRYQLRLRSITSTRWESAHVSARNSL